MTTKYRDNLTFSEALFLLKKGEYNMMRYKNPNTTFEGPFYHVKDGWISKMTACNKYDPIDLNAFTTEQLSGCHWHVSSANPPEGWYESAVDKTWYKPSTVDVWLNVYYDYINMKQDFTIHRNEPEASKDKGCYANGRTFVKTCHLQQQLSIPWRDV